MQKLVLQFQFVSTQNERLRINTDNLPTVRPTHIAKREIAATCQLFVFVCCTGLCSIRRMLAVLHRVGVNASIVML